MMKIVERLITKNPSYVANVKVQDNRYATFQKRGPLGLVLHSVGAAQPKAENIAAYFNNANTQASTQAVLQPDGTVLQMMPWNYRAWHVGGSANDTHVGVEMTEPGTDAIYYDKNYVLHIVDKQKALSFVQKTYAVAVELFAYLCEKYHLDPLKDGVILSHSECHKRGIGSDHGDPEHLWNAVGSGYTMDKFRKDVSKKLLTAEYESVTPFLRQVDTDTLKCYDAPGTTYNLVKTYKRNDVVEISKKWIGHTWGYTGDGWINLVYTIPYEEDEDMTQETFNKLANAWLTSLAEKAPSSWSKADREWAESNGYIKGDDQGRKMYKKLLTREEAIALLHRVIENEK